MNEVQSTSDLRNFIRKLLGATVSLFTNFIVVSMGVAIYEKVWYGFILGAIVFLLLLIVIWLLIKL